MQFEAKICLLTSFRDTCFIEIKPQIQPPKRGKFKVFLLLSAQLYYFLTRNNDTHNMCDERMGYWHFIFFSYLFTLLSQIVSTLNLHFKTPDFWSPNEIWYTWFSALGFNIKYRLVLLTHPIYTTQERAMDFWELGYLLLKNWS